MSATIDDATKIRVLEELLLQKNIEPKDLKGTDKETYLAMLENKFNAFLNQSSDFNRGDKVRWKKGLKNKKYPKEDQICMVVEVLETAKTQERDAGSPYYGEPLNLVLALLDDDNDLVLFHYDKRRFEIVEKAKINEGV